MSSILTERFINVWDKLKGYILTMVFAFCSCASGILIRKSFTLSGADAAVVRYLVQLITMFILARYNNLNPLGDKDQRRLLLLRGVAGMTSLLFGYCAIKYINPSDFKAIHHASIVITAILAKLFLNETLSRVHVFALVLTLVGVFLISQPSFLTVPFIHSVGDNQTNGTISLNDIPAINLDKHLVTGIIFSVFAAFGSGSARVILKKLSINDVHFSVATIYASYYGLPVSLAISIVLIASGISHDNFANEVKHLPLHLLFVLIAGFIGVIGQCMLNIALKYEDASKLAIVKTIDVMYAFILQYLFLDIEANVLSVIGAIILLAGAFIVLLSKMVEKKDWIDENQVSEATDKSNTIYTNF